jgi:hypothetical protein
MMIEKHDFRKNETKIFFVRGLDRPSRVENAGKVSVSAQAVLVTFRLSVTRDDPSSSFCSQGWSTCSPLKAKALQA